MSLFKRVSDNIRANLNALLDKAEDPVNMLNQYLRDMEEDIADGESAVARQLAVVKKLKYQYEDAAAMAEKRQGQAVEALEKGRDDLARKALEEKKLHWTRSDNYLVQMERNNEVAERLKTQLRDMKDEYEKLRAKKDSMVARMETAKAQKQIHGVMGGFARNDARRGFERMEEKVLQMEAEAQVAVELKDGEQSLDQELAALGNDDIDRELAELKEKVRQSK